MSWFSIGKTHPENDEFQMKAKDEGTVYYFLNFRTIKTNF